MNENIIHPCSRWTPGTVEYRWPPSSTQVVYLDCVTNTWKKKTCSWFFCQVIAHCLGRGHVFPHLPVNGPSANRFLALIVRNISYAFEKAGETANSVYGPNSNTQEQCYIEKEEQERLLLIDPVLGNATQWYADTLGAFYVTYEGGNMCPVTEFARFGPVLSNLSRHAEFLATLESYDQRNIISQFVNNTHQASAPAPVQHVHHPQPVPGQTYTSVNPRVRVRPVDTSAAFGPAPHGVRADNLRVRLSQPVPTAIPVPATTGISPLPVVANAASAKRAQLDARNARDCARRVQARSAHHAAVAHPALAPTAIPPLPVVANPPSIPVLAGILPLPVAPQISTADASPGVAPLPVVADAVNAKRAKMDARNAKDRTRAALKRARNVQSRHPPAPLTAAPPAVLLAGTVQQDGAPINPTVVLAQPVALPVVHSRAVPVRLYGRLASHNCARIAPDQICTVALHDLGPMKNECSFCGGLHFKKESTGKWGKKDPPHLRGIPHYSMCCAKGKVKLAMHRHPPQLLRDLLDGTHRWSAHFLKEIRLYNCAFQMASTSAKVDRTIRTGVQQWRVSGNIRHRMGPLRPDVANAPPEFAQIYIVDNQVNQVARRFRLFGALKPRLLAALQTMLRACNTLVQSCLAAATLAGPIGNNVAIILRADCPDQRVYNAPTVHEVAAFLPDGQPPLSARRDIVVHMRGGGVRNINELNPYYHPLHFVLLHPYGEPGFAPNIPHQPPPVAQTDEAMVSDDEGPMGRPHDSEGQDDHVGDDEGEADDAQVQAEDAAQVENDLEGGGVPEELEDTVSDDDEPHQAGDDLPADANSDHEEGVMSEGAESSEDDDVAGVSRSRRGNLDRQEGVMSGDDGSGEDDDDEFFSDDSDDMSDDDNAPHPPQRAPVHANAARPQPPVLRLGNTKVTNMQYAAYRLAVRNSCVSAETIHRSRRLFHEYVVDQYVAVEHGRLSWLSRNQTKIRADLYKGVMDAVSRGDNDAAVLGRRVILPSSFIGGPRSMNQMFQDCMAIVRVLGKPDLFITFTCNPKWKEIVESVYPGQNAVDRPDITDRVFKLKLQEMLRDLTKKQCLGRTVASIHVIEYQKRGLPHAHLLIIFAPEDKLRSPDDYDKVICAELPDKLREPRLFEIVTRCMIHGPCNAGHAACRPEGHEGAKCVKNFPKAFCEETADCEDGFPIYRWRQYKTPEGHNIPVVLNAGQTNEKEVDNSWVVPYNKWLCLKYNAHINVEHCASIIAVKYLFKYVYKGADRSEATFRAYGPDGQPLAVPVNEIDNFTDGRYIGTCEAVWRLFHFSLHGESPSVVRLSIHLEHEQSVSFGETANLAAIVAAPPKSTLMGWMEFNTLFPTAAPDVLYVDFARTHSWNKQSKVWKQRKASTGTRPVGRMYFVSPSSGEKFYLRLLLNHVPGATSFEFLRTIDGVVHPTYKDAAKSLGLLQNDDEWDKVLQEASGVMMPALLCELFATLLIFNSPTDPLSLWEKHKLACCEDILRTERETASDPQLQLTPVMCDVALRKVQESLRCHGKSLTDFPNMPIPPAPPVAVDAVPRIIQDQLGYDRTALAVRVLRDTAMMTVDQKVVYDTVIAALHALRAPGDLDPRAFFVDSPGGCGKTFMFNLILATARSLGMVALSVASSGIAALLLEGGCTAHSRFKIPIQLTDGCCGNMTLQSDLAKLFQSTKIIVWDEAPMIHKWGIEAVDLVLRDIMKCVDPALYDVPFGGVVIVFGGDFRQVLPVVQGANISAIIASAMNKSKLWPVITKLLHISKKLGSFRTECY